LATLDRSAIRAARQAGAAHAIDLVLPCAVSNHHAVIFDRHGRYPEFVCRVRLVDRDDVMDKQDEPPDDDDAADSEPDPRPKLSRAPAW
jgi:hypothetical protein